MKTCIILGTRPEIIKMSPVVRACERHGGQTGRMLAGIEDVLIEEKPDVVLVGGDMGGAGRRFVEACYDFSTATRLRRRITFKCEEV